ncbi:MAG TPA: class I SAM-dependent methyltransferase [Phycisphaerae bacterium]|nr:class I SAM-dependent methyltransferase [Phycisphaerae bacterium]HOQ84865.1 class I SAM-dependent methyltransferase [Phycisphaerae bacterium]HPZ96504.1 class I SAM-dependent methyltransferase [Phycisphaerae bacterium]HQE27906.1 class I SAM-dependent methyltransferase [Phycisphaerae bacterium]
MKRLEQVGLEHVRAVYAGPECDLWELIMGSQIHVGGLESSRDLANRAGIQPGSRGVDLCCCKGTGMLFLCRFCDVASMTGVDATEKMVEEGRARVQRQGFADRIQFVHAEATRTGLPAGEFDFVWGEDAWCYVDDKAALIAEAVRLVRPGGTIAFTDWVEGGSPLSDDEARRFMTFMKFPSFATVNDYARLLEQNGCRVDCGVDTGRFTACVNLYISMLERQLTYDALAILGFDQAMMEAVLGEMTFARDLAHEGKLAQARFVAVKR